MVAGSLLKDRGLDMSRDQLRQKTLALLRSYKLPTAEYSPLLNFQPNGDAKFTTRFVGTVAPATTATAVTSAAPPAQDVGVVFASSDGLAPSYRLTGRELYVRAIVTSDRPPLNPSFKGQLAQAWTQPVDWQQHARN